LSACSGDATPAATTVAAPSTTVDAATRALPLVGEIDDAVAALETKLGAPQEFFEINATSKLVNLIVALNDGKVAQPWVYLDGQLSSAEGAPADGHTFVAGALDFDPDKVLSQVETAAPAGEPRSVLHRGRRRRNRAVQRGRHLTPGRPARGVVGPDGAVQSVNPN
jgi:hypothetical protein